MNPTQNLPVSAADTDTPAEVVTSATILRGAAAYLAIRGWVQRYYYLPELGDNPSFPPACATGALVMATFGSATSVPVNATRHPDYPLYQRTVRLLSNHLERTEQTLTLLYDPHADEAVADIFAWNDKPDQTADHVIATLLAAADEYDWQHATADDLETYADICAWREEHPDREGFLAWLARRADR